MNRSLNESGGFILIKTFPLAAWGARPTITGLTSTGLTSTPLVLTDEFAQTYGPGHHNFTETFLYEPALDPATTAAQRAELQVENIRLIHVYHDRIGELGSDRVTAIGFDGTARVLP